MLKLPVNLEEKNILDCLCKNRKLVLTAPTGSGKSTQIPQILAKGNFIEGQILVLQPRRLAARMLAKRVAEEMNCSLGQEVGYQIRQESCISKQTKIRFMTEGVLLRLLLSKPDLNEIGAVVLDEFHERNWQSDLALSLLKKLVLDKRPDLYLLVMSATLEAVKVADYLGCSNLEITSRAFEVQVSYQPARQKKEIWDQAAAALKTVYEMNCPGDVLIFMPGAYEIRRTIEACRGVKSPTPVQILPLHGEMPAAQQDDALRQISARKVIVSTNVAETSLTIEGIRFVIDSSLVRQSNYDPHRGINTLLVEKVSQSSAIQRSGRAGRTASGFCIRLCSQSEFNRFSSHDQPGLHRMDLSEVILQLKALFINDLDAFDWFDKPRVESIQQAEELLQLLGAVDKKGIITATREAVNYKLVSQAALCDSLQLHSSWPYMLL